MASVRRIYHNIAPIYVIKRWDEIYASRPVHQYEMKKKKEEEVAKKKKIDATK